MSTLLIAGGNLHFKVETIKKRSYNLTNGLNNIRQIKFRAKKNAVSLNMLKGIKKDLARFDKILINIKPSIDEEEIISSLKEVAKGSDILGGSIDFNEIKFRASFANLSRRKLQDLVCLAILISVLDKIFPKLKARHVNSWKTTVDGISVLSFYIIYCTKFCRVSFVYINTF